MSSIASSIRRIISALYGEHITIVASTHNHGPVYDKAQFTYELHAEIINILKRTVIMIHLMCMVNMFVVCVSVHVQVRVKRDLKITSYVIIRRSYEDIQLGTLYSY